MLTYKNLYLFNVYKLTNFYICETTTTINAINISTTSKSSLHSFNLL